MKDLDLFRTIRTKLQEKKCNKLHVKLCILMVKTDQNHPESNLNLQTNVRTKRPKINIVVWMLSKIDVLESHVVATCNALPSLQRSDKKHTGVTNKTLNFDTDQRFILFISNSVVVKFYLSIGGIFRWATVLINATRW